jgi:cysteine desulfurase/selenocysteine lyase
MIHAKKLRKDFPLLKKRVRGKKLVYLDNAATTQKPVHVIEAMDSYYREHNANVHRAIHQLSEEATQLYENAHRDAAEFIGAAGMEEVIFTKNTTESLNLVAYSLVPTLKRGDEIVLTQMEHHSNLVPWQQSAKRHNITLKFIEIDDTGELDKKSIEKNITKKTKLVAVAHVSNSLGTINDVKTIAQIAHENGAVCIVDGAQSVPHMKVDVKRLDVDFLAFSAHKMLGPTGIGVLYGKKELLQEMTPFLYGGGMIREVKWKDTSFIDLPWKFEAGTPNVAEGVGLSAAIAYLKKIGMDNIEKQEKKMVEYSLKKLSSVKNITTYGPKRRAAVFSFNVDGVHAHDVSAILDSEGIAVRGGHHCTMPLMSLLGVPGTARASLSVYNDEDDIDMLIKGIEKVKKVFG